MSGRVVLLKGEKVLLELVRALANCERSAVNCAECNVASQLVKREGIQVGWKMGGAVIGTEVRAVEIDELIFGTEELPFEFENECCCRV